MNSISADSGQAVYTYGWDTAFAIPVTDVNKAIIDHGSSPARFSIQESGFSVTAEFGPWQVCQGGDGKDVRLLLPMKHGTLTYGATGKSFSFDSASAVVEVQLHYIPHGDANSLTPASGQPHALVVKNQSTDGTPVLSVISLQTQPALGTVTQALLQQALSDWGNANLGEFAHVFSVVDLNRMVDQGQWGFVTPNYTSYAYLDRDTLQDSVFAVLCMTGKRSGQQVSEEISALAIPAGSRAGFLVSQARTLQDLVRPAIQGAYPGLTNENFVMSDDGTTLYLTDHTSVNLPPVQKDGHPYHPRLTQLQVKSNGEILTLTSRTETEIAAGITATCTAVHWYKLALGKSGAGQTIVFTEAQPPSIVHEIHQSEGSQITQFVIELVAAVALLILAVLTDGAALVVGGLVIGLIMGADQMVPALIEKLNKDDSPAIDLLLVNAVDPVRWTGSSSFKLNYASLNMSLQLGGDPQFV